MLYLHRRCHRYQQTCVASTFSLPLRWPLRCNLDAFGWKLWMGDHGFFKINRALSGDFVVIARFGGAAGGADGGPDGVLFRYVNHTCFLHERETLVLHKSQVWYAVSYRIVSYSIVVLLSCAVHCRGWQCVRSAAESPGFVKQLKALLRSSDLA